MLAEILSFVLQSDGLFQRTVSIEQGCHLVGQDALLDLFQMPDRDYELEYKLLQELKSITIQRTMMSSIYQYSVSIKNGCAVVGGHPHQCVTLIITIDGSSCLQQIKYALKIHYTELGQVTTEEVITKRNNEHSDAPELSQDD